MQNTLISRDYRIIFKTFLNYFPSRIFVILNALVIVPIFAYFLSASQMSIFQISIGILNLICTCSTDWIAKSVLRFCHKYKISDELDKFFSTIVFLMIISFGLIFSGYFLFKNIIFTKFYVSNTIFFMTLILVIPCGIRQIFYQILRVLKMPFWYTLSIVIYQIALLTLFFAVSHFTDNVVALLMAMTFSVVLIDFIILLKLNRKENLSLNFDKKILKKILIYALPLVITNVCIWLILHFGKFVFQFNKNFVDTAIVGVAWFFVTNALTPLFSLLMFAIFPSVVRRFEKKYEIKNFMLHILKSYIVMFMPFVCLFCFFSFDIAKLAFRHEYYNLGILFPFSAVTIFIHEFMKLMNIKYHLKNRTYIETIISVVVAVLCVYLNLILIKLYGIFGFGISMLISILVLFLANSFIKFKFLEYFNVQSLLKSLIGTFIIALVAFFIVELMFIKSTNIFITIIQIIMFFMIYIFLTVKLNRILL